MTPGPDSHDSPALAAFSKVLRGGAEARSKPELDEGLSALLQRAMVPRPRRRGLVRWSIAGAMAAACLGVVWGLAHDARKARPVAGPELTYRIEGGSVFDGGYLREIGHAGMKVVFSEGSAMALAPGARGRLQAVDRGGARVAIEQGSASFDIVPSRERRWFVEVGPFLVAVKGTVFKVVWDPPHERFELNLRKGRVVVSGPMSGGDIALRAGQRLIVNLTSAETLITTEPAEAGAGEALAPSVDPSSGAAARNAATKPAVSNVVSSRPRVASSSTAGQRRWSNELARGHWDRILEEVDRLGVDAALESASSEDLLALADAARYRRRTELARAALLAELHRFPESPRALDAVFLLGRVEEAREHGASQAIAWYSEYLTRSSSGSYAAEALGRKMILVNEAGGPAPARPIAQEYLRRFPRGTYAAAARTLAGAGE